VHGVSSRSRKQNKRSGSWRRRNYIPHKVLPSRSTHTHTYTHARISNQFHFAYSFARCRTQPQLPFALLESPRLLLVRHVRWDRPSGGCATGRTSIHFERTLVFLVLIATPPFSASLPASQLPFTAIGAPPPRVRNSDETTTCAHKSAVHARPAIPGCEHLATRAMQDADFAHN
jgi:hypothetical protein